MESTRMYESLKESQALLDITKDLLQDVNVSLSNKEADSSVSSVGNFVKVPKRGYLMGSNEYGDESPQHLVNISYDFAISKYQVTVKEYLEFVLSTNSNYPEWVSNKDNIKLITMSHYKNINLNDDAPIVGVNWENAKAYCAWRSQRDGKMYRLPTEAEWEFACRAGSITRYNFGDNEKELRKYAWYNDNANQKTHSVGTKRENAWGLYDMHGNVWEWCEDIWADNYESTPRDGSANKIGDAKLKVLRGGSWADSSRYVRSSNRNGYYMDGCDNDLGFRLVLATR